MNNKYDNNTKNFLNLHEYIINADLHISLESAKFIQQAEQIPRHNFYN